MCDDIETTVADLTAKGVEFVDRSRTRASGDLLGCGIPGAGEIGLYEPRHKTAYDLEG